MQSIASLISSVLTLIGAFTMMVYYSWVMALIACITIPLTMYVARHAWASIARSRNIPLSIISESMGHDSESTTRIYLASLDNSAIDNANSIILGLL